MRNAIGSTGKVCLFVLTLVAPVLAQSWVQSGPAPAATGPDFDVSAGYTSLTMAMPAAGHAKLGGVDLNGRIDFNPHWGATVDSNYLRASNVLGTAHDGSVLILHAGPVFYPVDHGKTRIFLHLLGGVSRVNGALPENKTSYRQGWVVDFSYAAGGGIERPVSGLFALRVSADYLRTAFLDSTGAVRPQNNLRVTAGLVLHLNARRP